MTPASGRTLGTLWKDAAARFGGRPALTTELGTASYSDLAAASAQIAADLHYHGLTPGDAVTVDLTRGPLWIAALLGIWLAGGVFVPVPRHLPDVGERLSLLSGAQLHLADAVGSWPAGYAVHHTRTAVAPGVTAAHAYAMTTSGSTGAPKVALVTHASSTAVISGLATQIAMEPGEHALHTAAFSFSSSIRQMLVPLLSGARVTVATGLEPFGPGRLLALAHAVGITSLDLTPSHLAAVIAACDGDEEVPRPDALRRLLVASEALSGVRLSAWRRVVKVPHTLIHLYGQTETGGAVSALRDADEGVAGTGHLPLAMPFAPFTGYLEPQPDGAAELQIAGADPADGVLTEHGLDRGRYEARHGEASNLYRTGDLFTLADGGRVRFHGRADRQIKIMGVRVDAAAIERAVAMVPGIGSAVVVAVPRAGGSAVVGIGYTAGGDDPGREQIESIAAGGMDRRIPSPRALRMPRIPLTISGKADRAAVVAALQQGFAEPPDAGVDSLSALWHRHAGSGADDDFFRAGGDSLSMIGLLADIARVFGLRITPEQFHRDPTPAALRSLVATSHPVRDIVSAPRNPTRERIPATPFQRGLWISERLWGPAQYWLPVDFDVNGELDRRRISRAMRAVVDRYDALRLAFATEMDGDLTLVPERYSAADFRLSDELERDLGGVTSGGRLIRLTATALPGRTRIGLRVHHVIADRRSVMTILRSLCLAYDGALGERPAPSFIAWAADLIDCAPDTVAAAREFWERYLPPPGRRAAPQDRSPIERQTRTVPAGGVPSGSSRHASWLRAFSRAIAAAGLDQAELIGVDIDLRPPGITDLVGPCVTTLPAVVPAESDGAADGQGARGAGAAVARLLPYATVPIADVVPAARRPTGDPRQPFFRYNLVYQAGAFPPLRIGGLDATYATVPGGIAEHSVTLFVRETPTAVHLELAWQPGSLDALQAKDLLTAVATDLEASTDVPR